MFQRKTLYIFAPLLLLTGVVFYCDKSIEKASAGKLFSSFENIPYNQVGLLLGTGKYLNGGNINPYYAYRVEAAKNLIKAGKIKYLIISGDNSTKDYDEPTDMRNDLVAAGIDSNILFRDYAGFRTFDSMVRAKEIFGQTSLTVISQPFHNQRAIYIALREGIDSIGYNATDVSGKNGLKVQAREKLARVKVFADYLFGKQPKFLGEKVPMPVAASE